MEDHGAELKVTFTKSIAFEALEGFLRESLPFKMYEADFKRAIQQVIDETVTADEASSARHTLDRCTREEAGAAEGLNGMLSKAGRNSLVMCIEAKYAKAEALARSFLRGDAAALRQVKPLLSRHSLVLHDVLDPLLIDKIDTIDRINRLILDQRFLGSNHIRRPRPVCRTKYG